MSEHTKSQYEAPPIDPRIQWVTLTEALRVWHIKSRSTVIYAYWHQHVLMRKSGAVWLVYVEDMIQHFGMVREPLVIPD